MSRPQNNGLVEFMDDKQGMDGSWYGNNQRENIP